MAALHRAMRSCPASLPRAQCESLVRQAARSRHATSHPVREPSDCLEAMSKGECEELLTAENATAQDGSTVNVDECLDHPTPKCEKVLQEAYGAQIAAKEAGG